MLTDQPPNDVLIDWAKNTQLVKLAKDRPWFHSDAPKSYASMIRPNCRCHNVVELRSYPCEDGGGYIYLGQCSKCETIIWSFLECK